MNKRVLCGALAVLISLFGLSGCQNAATASPMVPNTLVSELSKDSLSVSGEMIAAFYQYNQRSGFNEQRMLPDMTPDQDPSWDSLTLFVFDYCSSTGISKSENQYIIAKDAFDRVVSMFFIGLKYEHHSSEYLTLKDDGYYPRGFDLPDSAYYRLTELSKTGDIFSAKFDGFVITESEFSAAGPKSGVSVSESVGPNMKAVMDYAKTNEIKNGQIVRDTMLGIFIKDDYAKNLRLDQKLKITFQLSGESEPALKYLSCHREYLTSKGLLPNVGR